MEITESLNKLLENKLRCTEFEGFLLKFVTFNTDKLT